MTDLGSLLGGGSGNSSSSLGGLLQPSSPKHKRKKKAADKPGRSILGLADNLVHDVGDAAMGVIPGVIDMSKAVAHDTGVALTGHHSSYELDNLGKAMLSQMKYQYAPLAHMDFKEFGKRTYQHPLGPVMDAFTIATLGAGGVVKGAKLLGDIGLAAKVTGGTARTLAEGEDAATALTKLRAGRGHGDKRVGMVKGNEIVEPGKRVLVGKAQKAEHGLPSAMKAGKGADRAAHDGAVTIGDYSENPFTRLQQKAVDALSEVVPGWSEKRMAHATRKAERNVERRGLQKAGFGAADAVLHKHAGEITPTLGRAVWNAAQGRTAAEEAARLEGEMKRILDTSNHHERDHALLATTIGKHDGAKAIDKIAEVLSAMDKTKRNHMDEIKRIEARTSGANIGGVVSKPFKPSAKSVNPEDAMRRAELVREIDRQRSVLANAMPDPQGKLTELAHVVKARADQHLVLPELQATLNIQKALAAGNLTGHETGLVNKIIRVLAPVAHANDQLIDTGAAIKGTAGRSSSKVLTAEQKDAGQFNVPHTADRSSGARAGKQGAQARRDPQRPPRPDSVRHDTGYNDRFGLDAAKPENVLATHKALQAWNTTMRTWKTVVDTMQPLPDGGLGHPPVGYRQVPVGVAQRFYENARSFLDDEAPVIFGEESPVLKQMRETIVQGLGERFASGPQMVPEKFFDHMMQEMQARKRFPVFDQVTGLWRLSVVSPLRPAFVTNNIIGQSALLMVAHTSLKGLRSIMQYASSPELRSYMRPYMGAVEGSGQSAVLGRETTAMLAGRGRLAAPMATARNLNEGLGRLSQAITDDPFRRYAFAMDVLPAARKLVKAAERGGKMVDGRPYVMHDALTELLNDPKVIDRVERKVLGDLVDFDNLTSTERNYIRRILPFYSWIKGSSALTLELVQKNPAYANMLVRTGQEGVNLVQQGAGGPLPDYMRGLVGLNSGGKDGVSRAVTTAAYNPFVTPADAGQQIVNTLKGQLGQGQSAFGPENPLSQTNPLVKALTAALTKKDPFTGKDASWESVLYGSIPQREFLPGGAAHQSDGIYSKGMREELAKYLGIPVRNVDVNKAINQQINPYQTVQFSQPAIDTRSKKGQAKLDALRKKLKEQYGG